MKTKKRFLTILSVLLCSTMLAQTDTSYRKLQGKWINTQYEYYLKKEPGKKLLSNISPLYIMLDSTYSCTILIKLEQRSSLGKPVAEKKYGHVRQLRFKGHYALYLTEIEGYDDLVSVSVAGNPFSIIFRKQE